MVKPVVTGKSIDTAADKVFSSQQIKEAVTTASSPHKELQWLCDFCNWLTKSFINSPSCMLSWESQLWLI